MDSRKSFADCLKHLEETDLFLGFKQIGTVPRKGTIEAYTGKDSMDWAGHIVGDNYVVFGNVLDGAHVVPELEMYANQF